ncbi:replication protein [Pantoea piersonii]|uniref:replication protein n=1 Tax=Pantoea piersonii TaxID=2364647 RepID=UPI00289E5CC0|nr:replication protein [Pantoea piersonii]
MSLALANVTPIRPEIRAVEQRVADTDDGYTRLANELYEELIGANLTRNQAKVAHAVCRKTYGFNKKMDRIADSQISQLTRLPRQKVNKAKNELIQMGVLVREGMLIGPNKNLAEWQIPERHQDGVSVTKTVTKSVTKTVTGLSPKQGHTKDTITKDKKDNINKPPVVPQNVKSKSFDPLSATLPEWLSQQTWESWVTYRKDLKKPIKSQQTVTQALNLLDRSRAKGFPPEDIINKSIANGWQGLFEPDNSRGPARQQSAPSRAVAERFSEKDYGSTQMPSWAED